VGEIDPTLFLFDAQPGGVGLSERIFEIAPTLFGRARDLIAKCPCSAGCPACVGPTEESPRKRLALDLIDAMGIAEPPVVH
jgi:DEAD/DEAH box helicase domain-containing protein